MTLVKNYENSEKDLINVIKRENNLLTRKVNKKSI